MYFTGMKKTERILGRIREEVIVALNQTGGVGEHKDDMQEQHRVLRDAIVRWQGTHEQIDDMVLVGIKI